MNRLRSLAWALLILAGAPVFGQDRLKELVDIASVSALRSEIQSKIKVVRPRIQWTGPTTIAYQATGAWVEIDATTGRMRTLEVAPTAPPRSSRADDPNSKRRRPERGRQFEEAFSPDGKQRVFYRNGNLWMSDADGSNEIAVTTEGDASKRIKYGSASWVYGEELGQRDAMGWSPDGKKVWFYRFDDSMVKDYFITTDQTKLQTTLDVEAYPKAGTPNPECDIYIYDLFTKKRTKVGVRPGAFDEGVGHYVYGISWSPDGKELFFHRTNRWQNTMEFCAANPSSGDVRVIVREEWLASWTNNYEFHLFLDEDANIAQSPQYKGKMLWQSSRNGFANFYIVDLATGKTKAITKNSHDALRLVNIDLVTGEVFYMAQGPDNPFMQQLRVAKLDGSSDVQVTDSARHHTVVLAPGGKYFIDTEETMNVPPRTTLRAIDGKPIAVLSESSVNEALKSGYRAPERVVFTAGDGKTKCYGAIEFPANFDPSKKYPVIVDVYGGPESGGHSERYGSWDRKTDYGFIVASFAGRWSGGRGKAIADSLYLKLGQTEIDDMAEGVRALGKLPYIDSTRVGITGASYGGTSSVMCLLRYPDLFLAAVASSGGYHWKHYDTIYTERYMRTPGVNPEGYENGSPFPYIGNLKGWLLLYYGTADNNCHPSNTLGLIQSLQKAGKYFEVQVGPDQGHSDVRFERMMEFFVERLVISGPRK